MFRKWAASRKLDLLLPFYKDILAFHYDGWKQDLKPNMLNDASCSPQFRWWLKNLSMNKHTKHFLKGRRELAPPVRYRFHTWALLMVL